jgi:SAM-dependent methyltransferase
MDESERAALAEQYADAENLNARVRLHERHDTADRVPPGWDRLLTDFLPGMVTDARATLAGADSENRTDGEPRFAVAAVEALPLPADSVDVVFANHMLYHVDREVALPEIRRVLRPGGRLYATTNGESNLRELRALITATSDFEPPSATEFSLENGPDQLARHFESVERIERSSELRVPDLEPLVAYAGSLPPVGRAELDAFADLAAEKLDDPPFTTEKSMGMLVARAP